MHFSQKNYLHTDQKTDELMDRWTDTPSYDALQGSEEFEYHAITWPLIPIFMHFFESTWVL